MYILFQIVTYHSVLFASKQWDTKILVLAYNYV